MPISALPQETVRAIGASQVLTDSASVVKEFVDNALDAHASAVFIEISANTLDIIQVRDNGYGIAPADRNLVCKRSCTSKIISFEEISTIGGQSLGFRGEALASAAEMSGSLVVSTRIEGEAAAVCLRIGRQGAIESEERISHPVGTTMRIVDYLKNIPVRRQSALKTSAKTLAKIKRALQAYALARPKVRFSFKVLKAKTDKDNWMYAPKAEASTADAATKVVGKKVTDQCEWKSWSTLDAKVQGSKQDIYRIQCLLPRPDCDISSINNVGQFLSVDSRPVSCARGAFKQIVSLFKSSLKSISADRNGGRIVDPFLCMNMVCLSGSYDANIEPAKDDVLFTDAQFVLQLVELFFREVYGDTKVPESTTSSKRPRSKSGQTFDLLLARKQPILQGTPIRMNNREPETPSLSGDMMDLQNGLEDESPGTVQGTPSTGLATDPATSSKSMAPHDELDSQERASASTWKANMYTVSDDDDGGLFLGPNVHNCQREDGGAEEESGLRDVQVSNPWTIAKVNAPIRSRLNPAASARLLTPARQKGDVGYESENPSNATLPVEQAFPSPDRTHRDDSSIGKESSSPERFPYPLKARKSCAATKATSPSQPSNHERYGPGALDTWVQKSLPSSDSFASPNARGVVNSSSLPSATASDQAGGEALSTHPQTGNTRPRDFVSARTLPTGTPVSEIPSMPQRPTRKARAKRQAQTGAGINKPFISPVNDLQKVWFDVGPTAGRRGRSPQKGHSQSSPSGDRSLPIGSDDIGEVEAELVHPDLAMTLEYEARKADAIQKRRTYLRQLSMSEKQLGLLPSPQATATAKSTSSPHTNRYNKAVAALDPDGAEVPDNAASSDQASVFEAGDPRAYLLRLQRRLQTPGRDHSISPSRARSGTSSRRRKTAMLPLESISDSNTTRDLELPLPSKAVNSTTMGKNVQEARSVDEYVKSGTISNGLKEAKAIEVARAWEVEIATLIREQYKRHVETGEQWALKIELWPILQAHSAAQDAGNEQDNRETE